MCFRLRTDGRQNGQCMAKHTEAQNADMTHDTTWLMTQSHETAGWSGGRTQRSLYGRVTRAVFVVRV